MASDLNRVILIGRFVKDPELRYTQSGAAVANFSVANNRSYMVANEKKEYVSYFNCIAWGKLGELLVQYCKKGHRIAIEGRLQQRSWDDPSGAKRYAVEIVVENFQFLTPRSETATGAQEYSGVMAAPMEDAPIGSDNPFNDDDIPF